MPKPSRFPISTTTFALLLLMSSGIATAVATSVALGVTRAEAPCSNTTVDTFGSLLRAAVDADRELFFADSVGTDEVQEVIDMYLTYANEAEYQGAQGVALWARGRGTELEEVRTDMIEMERLKAEALRLDR